MDQKDDGYAVRRLGALLLARRLGDFENLSREAPRVVVYPGTNKLETRLDQVLGKGYAVGFQELVGFIMGQLPQSEVIEGAIRKENRLVPEITIRELVANALIHQDFSIGGASMIVEIYANRVEISNPGEPVVPVERFIDGYQSRNERLADLMRRMGICEEKSSGIDKVIHAAEVYQLPAPDFRAGYRREPCGSLLYILPGNPGQEADIFRRAVACRCRCSFLADPSPHDPQDARCATGSP